jgi:hypothetical protein
LPSFHVRCWPLADIFNERVKLPLSNICFQVEKTICGMSAFAVAIGGKADMAFCTAYVRF